jgi:hypothetical protein
MSAAAVAPPVVEAEERHACPFCGASVGVVVLPAMRAFELHLDGHMARGDRLPAA